MRPTLSIVALGALLAAPAAAQMTMGGPNSMSAIPGTTLPGSEGADADATSRAISERQAAMGQRRESPAYQENLRIRRQQAEQYAAAARNGAPLPADAAETLRSELEADIGQWRAEFDVGRQEWQAMRDRWLVSRDSLSAQQWALRRVAWWTARDDWVARHRR